MLCSFYLYLFYAVILPQPSTAAARNIDDDDGNVDDEIESVESI